MTSFKTVVLFSLVVGLLGAQADDTLDNLLRRILTELQINKEKTAAENYLKQLIAEGVDDETGASMIDKAVIINSRLGHALTSQETSYALKLTPAERGAIASAVKSGNYNSLRDNGLTAEGVRYNFIGQSGGVANALQRDKKGALTIMDSSLGVIVAHSRKGGLATAIDAVHGIANKMEFEARQNEIKGRINEQ